MFGTGYLGATHAAGMAELGHDVVGVDIDPGKIAKLGSGDTPFYEPGLPKLLADNLAAGRLRFTTDYDMAADFADVHFLGVATPQKKGEYGADLRQVHAVIAGLVPRLTRPSVIVGKSLASFSPSSLSWPSSFCPNRPNVAANSRSVSALLRNVGWRLRSSSQVRSPASREASAFTG